MIKVLTVEPLDEYKLKIEFDNHVTKIFDMKNYLNHGLFSELVDINIFRSVKVSYDSLEWINGADICPDELYDNSIPYLK